MIDGAVCDRRRGSHWIATEVERPFRFFGQQIERDQIPVVGAEVGDRAGDGGRGTEVVSGIVAPGAIRDCRRARDRPARRYASALPGTSDSIRSAPSPANSRWIRLRMLGVSATLAPLLELVGYVLVPVRSDFPGSPASADRRRRSTRRRAASTGHRAECGRCRPRSARIQPTTPRSKAAKDCR